MERNFVHFFIVKKKWNFRPMFLGNMDILKKRGYQEIGTEFGTAIEIGRELSPPIGRC
jgi:hypothetical protein